VARTPGQNEVPVHLTVGPPVAGADFFGREAEVRRFWQAVKRQSVLFVAPRRVGKTSLLTAAYRAPRDGWTPIFSDFAGLSSEEACLARLVDDTRDRIGADWTDRLKDILGRLSVEAELGAAGVTARIGPAGGRARERGAAEIVTALKDLAATGPRLLLLLDEFPMAIKAMCDDGRVDEARRFLQLVRSVRTSPDLAGRIAMAISGSIGLMPLLHRHGMSAEINDLKPFRIGPWSETTARAFMDRIARTEELRLSAPIREAVLRRTGRAPVPFHLQKMLDLLRDSGVPPDALSDDDVGRAFERAVQEADLHHYRERLDSILDADEVGLAIALLDRVGHGDGPSRKTVIETAAASGFSASTVRHVLQTLVDDGYLVIPDTDESGRRLPITDRAVAFANPMLAHFWTEA